MFGVTDSQLEAELEHIVECWDNRLRDQDDPHTALSHVYPDADERGAIAVSLLDFLTLQAVHTLPPDLLRFCTAGYRLRVEPELCIKSMLMAEFLPQAQELVQAILSNSTPPPNVVPFDKSRLH